MDYIVTQRPNYFNFPNFCSIEDCVGILEKSDSIGFDSETTSLSFADGSIRTFQFSDGTDNFIVDIESGIDPRLFKKLIEGKELIGQNLQFDLCFLYAVDIVPSKLFDLLILEQILSLGIRNWDRDLGALLENYLDVIVDKSLQSKMATEPLNNPVAIEYMFNDVKFLHRLRSIMTPLLREFGAEKAHRLHCSFSRVISYMEYSGLKIDQDRLVRMYREYEAKEWYAEDMLNKYLIENTDIDPLKFNWASPAQVKKLLKSLGYNLMWHGEETINQDMLSKRYKNDAFILQYIEYKKLAKQATTYGRNFANYPFSDGLIHTKFRNIGTDTGRIACGNMSSGNFPNILNLPSSGFRRVFKPRNARYTFIVADYSQQEVVIAVDLSKEPKLMEFFNSGHGDTHSYVAKMIFSKELGNLSLEEINKNHKDLRTISKSTTFTILYGGSKSALSDNAGVSEDEAQAIMDKFFGEFDGLYEYKNRVTQEALDKGYVLISKVTGAKRLIENYDYYKLGKYSNKDVQSFENNVAKMSLNAPCQGLASEIGKTAGILFFDYLIQNKLFKKVFMPVFLYDEWVIESPKNIAEENAAKLKECMIKAGSYFLEDLSLKVEPIISEEWNH